MVRRPLKTWNWESAAISTIPVVKKLWEFFLTGNYSGTELAILATERFGLVNGTVAAPV